VYEFLFYISEMRSLMMTVSCSRNMQLFIVICSDVSYCHTAQKTMLVSP